VSFDAWAGETAPPRDNGELVFAEPWHARVFALAVATVEQLDLEWRDFQQHLIAQIALDPEREYYESWAAALESLIIEHGLSTADAITAATPTERAPL
jgi:nitrile hydratase accessory protein